MAKKSSRGTQHSIHGGLSPHAAPVNDSSRKLPKGPSVNEGSTRSGVAVGDSDKGRDSGVLK